MDKVFHCYSISFWVSVIDKNGSGLYKRVICLGVEEKSCLMPFVIVPKGLEQGHGTQDVCMIQ